MAYVNVADWKPDQVADWLKGLDVSIHRYVESFLNNHVNGQHLLNLQPDDLEHHGIYKVGHQEIILEAVDHLRNFHYELDHENLQLLALRVSCLAHSLYRELWNSSPVVSTQILSDVATIIKAVKPLVCWLDRPPFSGQLAFIDKKAELLRLSLEMATSGQRDKFADRPIEIFRNSAKRLSELADEMIREIHDPLLLQPSSLDLATLKKRPGDHLGFCIIPSFHGIHQIGDIKCNSTAYQSGKIECGDEIVQINYQTVVGWDVKQVMALFEESSSDIFLTLKKRPCHSKILGQIYMKPYRLPSKKQVSYGWFLGDTITPPRINLGGHIDIKPLGHKLVSSVTSFNKNRKPESFENIKEDDLDNNNQHKVTEKEEPADELGDVDDDNEHEDDEEEEEEEEVLAKSDNSSDEDFNPYEEARAIRDMRHSKRSSSRKRRRTGAGPRSRRQRQWSSPPQPATNVFYNSVAGAGGARQTQQPYTYQPQARAIMGPAGRTMGPAGQTMGPASRTMGPANRNRGPAPQMMGPASRTMGPAGQMMGPGGKTMGPASRTMGPPSQMGRHQAGGAGAPTSYQYGGITITPKVPQPQVNPLPNLKNITITRKHEVRLHRILTNTFSLDTLDETITRKDEVRLHKVPQTVVQCICKFLFSAKLCFFLFSASFCSGSHP
uniref:Connector enhancer of kinase suppressor of ras 3 n=1 Tax=Cacopsylla melanoneura TaxID=428564 RepID=A0A8D8T9K1_9HEMI